MWSTRPSRDWSDHKPFSHFKSTLVKYRILRTNKLSKLLSRADEDASVTLHDDFVFLDEERYFARDGTVLAVSSRTENRFEGVYIDGVVEWWKVFGGLSGRRRECFDDGVDKCHFSTPRILGGGEWFWFFS
ncbi:hypothetical protein GCM10009000_052960 [Halobacterium noricense]